ncbi:MAG: DUF433 domain-containing protein [Candidatus Sulfotelmatobacter sp.]
MHTTSVENFLRNLDPRSMPRYTFGEAGRYLGIPESTLRSWFSGTTYGIQPNLKVFKPILDPGGPDLLSFYDIASAHVLLAMKAKGVAQDDLRVIVEGLRREYPESLYPLLGRNFFLFGRDVVVKKLGTRLNLSRSRQLGIKAVMDKFLARIELDANLMPVRFSPLRSHRETGKGYIVIDPDLAAGRPVVRGTGIPAEVIAKRKKSGESVTLLAQDYRISRRAVEEAIKYFPTRKAA